MDLTLKERNSKNWLGLTVIYKRHFRLRDRTIPAILETLSVNAIRPCSSKLEQLTGEILIVIRCAGLGSVLIGWRELTVIATTILPLFPDLPLAHRSYQQ